MPLVAELGLDVLAESSTDSKPLLLEEVLGIGPGGCSSSESSQPPPATPARRAMDLSYIYARIVPNIIFI